jgi:hypothetical protein
LSPEHPDKWLNIHESAIFKFFNYYLGRLKLSMPWFLSMQNRFHNGAWPIKVLHHKSIKILQTLCIEPYSLKRAMKALVPGDLGLVIVIITI